MTKFHSLIAFTSSDIGQYMYCNCLLTRLWHHEFWNYSNFIFLIKPFLLCILWLLLVDGRLEKGYLSTQIWDYSNISQYPKIPSLKPLGNLWGKSYTKFVILDIMFRFYFWQIGLY